MPDINIHRGDEELGGVQPHKYYHNVSVLQIFLSLFSYFDLDKLSSANVLYSRNLTRCFPRYMAISKHKQHMMGCCSPIRTGDRLYWLEQALLEVKDMLLPGLVTTSQLGSTWAWAFLWLSTWYVHINFYYLYHCHYYYYFHFFSLIHVALYETFLSGSFLLPPFVHIWRYLWIWCM